MGGKFEFSESGYNKLINRENRSAFLLENYLESHALTREYLEKWNVSIHEDHLEFRCHSFYGTYQYSLLRFYEQQPRYKFAPALAKVFNSLYGINFLPELNKNLTTIVTEGAADTIAVSEHLNIPSVSLLTANMSSIQETLLSLINPLFWIDGDKRGDEFSLYLLEHDYRVLQVRDEDPASTIKKYPNIARYLIELGLNEDLFICSRIEIDINLKNPILTFKDLE